MSLEETDVVKRDETRDNRLIICLSFSFARRSLPYHARRPKVQVARSHSPLLPPTLTLALITYLHLIILPFSHFIPPSSSLDPIDLVPVGLFVSIVSCPHHGFRICCLSVGISASFPGKPRKCRSFCKVLAPSEMEAQSQHNPSSACPTFATSIVVLRGTSKHRKHCHTLMEACMWLAVVLLLAHHPSTSRVCSRARRKALLVTAPLELLIILTSAAGSFRES